jgi:hypothetical protein
VNSSAYGKDAAYRPDIHSTVCSKNFGWFCKRFMPDMHAMRFCFAQARSGSSPSIRNGYRFA